MIDTPHSAEFEQTDLDLPRLFLREPGWKIAMKNGSEREFCHAITPGQDHYHRLADGEIYLVRGDERLCLPCAGRRGLLVSEPKVLREPVVSIDLDREEGLFDYDLEF
jgi:hypothetical protein